MTETAQAGMPLAGDPIEVQNRFDGTWVDGFEVAAVLADGASRGYRIRRLSDGAVLPAVFPVDAVVPAAGR